MEAATYRAAKAQVVELMLQGQPWHEAVAAAGLRISRSTAYQQGSGPLLLCACRQQEGRLVNSAQAIVLSSPSGTHCLAFDHDR